MNSLCVVFARKTARENSQRRKMITLVEMGLFCSFFLFILSHLPDPLPTTSSSYPPEGSPTTPFLLLLGGVEREVLGGGL